MIEVIVDKTCELWKITSEEFWGKGRRHPLSLARAMVSHALWEHLHLSIVEISKRMKKHHTSIIHYMNLWDVEYTYNREFRIFANVLDKTIEEYKESQDKELEMVYFNKKRSKYNNKKTEYNGIKFDSKKEKDRYVFLKEAEDEGLIKDLQLQVSFELIPPVKEEYVEHLKTKDKIKTRTLQHAICYTCDFSYYKGEEYVVEDIKASPKMLPADFRLKEKMFRWKYGFPIKKVFNPNEPL